MEELEHIVEHGYFEVAWEDVTSAHLPSDSSRPCGQMQVLLNFPPTKKASMEEDAVHNMVVWTKEDIDDFIRQLGLLEKGKERDVQAFQKIFEVYIYFALKSSVQTNSVSKYLGLLVNTPG